MSLLSAQDILDIRAAVKLATDTFMVTPVTYDLGVISTDVFQEGNNKAYTTYNLAGLAEFPATEGTKSIETKDGVMKDFEIKLTFNSEDISAAGLYDTNNSVKMEEERDYFTCKGIRYRVVAVKYDGPLNARDVLVIVYGKQLLTKY